MTTTIYQKYIARYSDFFTLVCIDYGDDEHLEIIPHAKASRLNQEEYFELAMELTSRQNEKAYWEE